LSDRILADPSPAIATLLSPDPLARWLRPFADAFTAPTWRGVLVLVTGALLSPGRRTVTAALSVLGLREVSTFTTFHRVLNRNRWSGRQLARCLLRELVAAFVPEGPVVVGIDETIERRWGVRIKARGIYRDPVRSSHGHFVKASGLRWMSIMLLAPVPWAGRVWALPFLTPPPSATPTCEVSATRSSPTGRVASCCRPHDGCPGGGSSRWPT
jgi:hypothetical protein